MTVGPDAAELAAYDAAADDPAVRAAFIGLDEHYHDKHHDAEDDDSIEVCCVAAMLDAAGYVDTFDACEKARADERQRIRVALDALTVALVKPGLGPAHQEAFHVVPRQALDDLLDRAS